jgi:hypothetical protein
MAKTIRCPHCYFVHGVPGFYMDHHILRCGDTERYEFGRTTQIMNINFKKAVRS